MRSSRWLVLVIVGHAASSSRGAAAPRTAGIEVMRAVEAVDCPDAATLTAKVNRTLGRRAIESSGVSDLRLAVEFGRPESQGYRATLRTYGRQMGERHITDPGRNCADLAD